jgi:hypothetical protein
VSHSSEATTHRPLTIMIRKRVLGLLCAFALIIILIAGLWPFHAPRNQVSWLSNSNGLHFGEYGLILSPGVFDFAGSKDGASCTLEIWLQPDYSDIGGTILAFYKPENRQVTFSVHQSIDDLSLRRVTVDRQRSSETKLYVEHVFRGNNQLFVSITSSPQGAAVYLNGALVRTSPRFVLSSEYFSGQLVLGNYPLVENGWQGSLKGLAIYDKALTAAQVLQHYNAWTANQSAEIERENPIALYIFREGSGNSIHNQMSSEADLRIPERFFVLHAPFLKPPWSEYQPGWEFWKNVLINVGGFVPLGFFFRAYFVSVGRIDRAVIATIVLGGIVSLTIEVLQAFLPTRDSGITDLITNTLGTAIGAMLYSSDPVRSLFAAVGLRGSVWPDSHANSH